MKIENDIYDDIALTKKKNDIFNQYVTNEQDEIAT